MTRHLIAGTKAASQAARSRHRSVPMEYGGGREYDLEKEFGPLPKRIADAEDTGMVLLEWLPARSFFKP